MQILRQGMMYLLYHCLFLSLFLRMSAISDAFFELDRNNQMLSCRVFGSHIRGILLPQPNYQYTGILLYEPWFVGVPLRSWEIKSRAAEAQRGSQVAYC